VRVEGHTNPPIFILFSVCAETFFSVIASRELAPAARILKRRYLALVFPHNAYTCIQIVLFTMCEKCMREMQMR
jgi:hypothetical protein